VSSNYWLNALPWLATAQGGPNGAGAGSVDVGNIQYRDPLDAARAGALGRGRIGEADYPDGYLDTINTRRQDRLDNTISQRLTDRHYQRGVHAGVKMDPVQYFWPEECAPDQGIVREMRGRRTPDGVLVKRQAPIYDVVDRLTHGTSYHNLTDLEQAQAATKFGVSAGSGKQADAVDPLAAKLAAKDLPPWLW
jgi:hypothetical protein